MLKLGRKVSEKPSKIDSWIADFYESLDVHLQMAHFPVCDKVRLNYVQ